MWVMLKNLLIVAFTLLFLRGKVNCDVDVDEMYDEEIDNSEKKAKSVNSFYIYILHFSSLPCIFSLKSVIFIKFIAKKIEFANCCLCYINLLKF